MENSNNQHFDEHEVIHRLKHYLPAQAPLKDFIHHNTLHAFQHEPFDKAIFSASKIFGYKVSLNLSEYRQLFREGKIQEQIVDRVIAERKGEAQLDVWKDKLLHGTYHRDMPRIGQLRSCWKRLHKVDLDSLVHPLLFRILGSYLDQGIAMWSFPVWHKGFLASIRELERISKISFFRTTRARNLLLKGHCKLHQLLRILIGFNESLYERYLFDQQFAHQGWSGMVAVLEDNPQALLDHRKISLHDLITLELLFEIDALDFYFGEHWLPLEQGLDKNFEPLFEPFEPSELDEVTALWQAAYEWSFYDEVLHALQKAPAASVPANKSFQAIFCIDDRECSLRRWLEYLDPSCQTFGTPGFFGVPVYFQPDHGKFFEKLCPAPVTPRHLIKEIGVRRRHIRDLHLGKRSHSLFRGWLTTQTLGFWAAVKLFINIFRPSLGPATASSFRHMERKSKLIVEREKPETGTNNLQLGFTVPEMADCVEKVLKSIGLVNDFARLVYAVGHGASSVNNPHYAAYDCGACSGRPGSVNARVFSYMANHKEVRKLLADRGVIIPDNTRFIGALHDTTRDEIEFYDEDELRSTYKELHQYYSGLFEEALSMNAKERSRRFILVNTKRPAEEVHEDVKRRSVSLFEPRPELNHATNALCIVGRREISKHLFLDRRVFLNSYDYRLDPEGMRLLDILRPAAPVCGGINLEYYFSRTDNRKLGAGTKLPHNVVGLIGVANGIDGDLRPGLPSQMIEVHDPVRLLMIVEHYPEVVSRVIQQDAATLEWFINEWIHLVAIHPDTKRIFRFKGGTFHEYTPFERPLKHIDDLEKFVEQHHDNLPVYLLSK
jgi:uncharacterized protein YbcC (UPF0753/DUF2309 family)